MCKHFLLLVLLIVAATPAIGAEIVFHGKPLKRVDADFEHTKQVEVANDESLDCLIIIDSGEFYWASREFRPLVYRHSGVFHMFIDPFGGGYIKIYGKEKFNGSALAGAYVEHLSLGLSSINYNGNPK
ncbi:hypothetical protein [Halodesulfovibrio aestuarii]|uniref:hypothetical protein n=1 Tax=Halodesulfovibrio aestuarii TaxID=126333 RepID=UPI00048014C1